MVSDTADSMLVAIGKRIAPVFKPLGFGRWECAAALMSGLGAKEAVVSTLSMLMGGEEAIGTLFSTNLQAISFLVFTLLYMPCVAAMAAVKRELGGMGKAAGMMAFQTGVAWIVSFMVYTFGFALGF